MLGSFSSHIGSYDAAWKSLDQQTVDAPSINALKGRLDKLRQTRVSFFID